MLKLTTTRRSESEVIEAVVDVRIRRIVERCLKEHERLHTTSQVRMKLTAFEAGYQGQTLDEPLCKTITRFSAWT
jgi:hypothetical protein